MPWVEEIRVRVMDMNITFLQKALLTELVKTRFQERFLQAIRIMKHHTVETDFAIFLEWSSDECPAEGSTISRQLSQILAGYGVIHRSIWEELK